MSVELPELDTASAPPRAPRTFVWIGVFAVVTSAGIAISLLTWPRSEPTSAAWFWMRTLGVPALSWCVMFGLRLHYHDEQQQRLQAEREVLAEARKKAIRFASEPLAVLNCAYLTGPGSAGVAGQIAAGKLALSARTSAAGVAAIRHTPLVQVDGADIFVRYRACFDALLDRISEPLMALPSHIPVDVRLHLPVDAAQQDLLPIWASCWAARNFPRAPASLLSVEQGVMALDEWLDVRGGPALERVTAFISVQLHDSPPQSSAEAAVAMLLAWAPLAPRHGLTVQALLHRPVEALPLGMDATLSTALQWGDAAAEDVNDLWQAGLSPYDQQALLLASSARKLGVSKTPGLSGLHAVDLAIGHPGVCVGWLDLAFGIERAVEKGTPQLMAWHEGNLRLAIARPPRSLTNDGS